MLVLFLGELRVELPERLRVRAIDAIELFSVLLLMLLDRLDESLLEKYHGERLKFPSRSQ